MYVCRVMYLVVGIQLIIWIPTFMDNYILQFTRGGDSRISIFHRSSHTTFRLITGSKGRIKDVSRFGTNCRDQTQSAFLKLLF